MKVITATELSKNLSRVLDSLQNGTEEIIIIRKKNPIARLIPGAPQMTALEALSDLYRTLPDEEGKNWYRDARRGSRRIRKEIRDPWR